MAIKEPKRKHLMQSRFSCTSKASEAAKEHGIKSVRVELKGIGAGKDALLRKQIEVSGITVTEIKDVTPVPHNGT